MIVGWELPVAVTGGAIAGGGVFLAVRELLPAAPSLGSVLSRLAPEPDAPVRPAAPGLESALGTWGFLARYLTIPAKELAILGKGPDTYLTSVAVSSIAGLIAPAVLTTMLTVAGIGPHLVLPLLLGPVCALLFGLLAHRDVLAKGAVARREFTRTFCTYLDLVILELTAAGPVQALERAARISHGWVFRRLDDALTQAQMQLVFPWDQLRTLADEIGLIELHDFAAIMRSAGDSGARVQETLHEQVEALRDRLRTDALTRAEAVSARLEMPAALLVIVLAIFIIYPLIARLG